MADIDYRDFVEVLDNTQDEDPFMSLSDMNSPDKPDRKIISQVNKVIKEAEKEAENEDTVEDEEETPRTDAFDERSSMEEDDILRAVKKDRDAAVQAQANFAERIKSCYNAYHAIVDAKYNIPGRSSIVSSDVMDTIEWMMPSLMRVFTASHDIVVIQPVGGEDVTAAEQHQALLNYQFNYKMEGFTKFYTWFKDALIYGFGVIKITWETFYEKKSLFYEEMTEDEFTALSVQTNISIESFDEYEDVSVIKSEDAEGNKTETVETATMYRNVVAFIKKNVYSGPWIENIPVSSFYIEPGARSVREANFVGHRVRRTMDYLRRMEREGIYHNVSEVIPYAEGDSEYSELAQITELEGDYAGLNKELIPTPSDGREYKWVWECWVKLDIDGDGLLEPLLVTFTDDVLLRVEENPFDHGEPPFETLVPIVDCHRLYGISITDMVVEFQRMKTSLYRNIFDNIAFSVNNFYLVARNSGTDIGALINVKPGAVVFTEDVNQSVREMKPETMAPTIFNLFEYLDTCKENRSGITRYSQGLDSKSLNSTATGVSAIMTASQQRIELIARLLAETGVKYAFRKMIALNQQFITDKMVLRLFNKPLEITPDKLDGSFDLMVNVGIGAGLKELQQSQMLNLLNILPSLAQLGLVKPKHVHYVVSKLLESMGYKDIENFIELPPEGAGMPQGQQPSVEAQPMQVAEGQGSPLDAPSMFGM